MKTLVQLTLLCALTWFAAPVMLSDVVSSGALAAEEKKPSQKPQKTRPPLLPFPSSKKRA